MSDADVPEVMQGRLGWESGDVSEADPSNLNPHPKNAEIYGDTDDADELDATFKESVAEKGVLEPLVITNGKKIISGHRRWLAAKDAGLNEVPVRYSEFYDDLGEREALIEFNRQREKTPGQIVNEFEEILAVEEERAKERQGKRSDLEEHPGNVSRKSSDELAREKAAEQVNADVSGRTLEKGRTVRKKAESDDEPEEVREAAREAWNGLQSNSKSFTGAYNEVKEAEERAEEQQAQTPELPSREYDVIVADPPWRYDFSKTSNREVENKYSTMPLSDIKELEVPATSDAVLYLWATAPKLKEAFAVIEAWDFEYKTNIVWDKEQIGMGYWARGQHEHLLIAGRGDISPPDVDDRRSSVVSPQTVHENRREHSRKPDCVLDMIADQHEGADIIEMFARQGRENVDSWGAEAPAEVSDDD